MAGEPSRLPELVGGAWTTAASGPSSARAVALVCAADICAAVDAIRSPVASRTRSAFAPPDRPGQAGAGAAAAGSAGASAAAASAVAATA